jgi:heptosyltransferase I
MNVLIIKTSSMGDVIHTLPALTDAGLALPGISFDWVVEESFTEIPSWHPLVQNIIPVAWRRWRKQLFANQTRLEMVAFYQNLRAKSYDVVIDAQGLIKSAVISRLSRGFVVGYDSQSAREAWSAKFYQKNIYVPRQQHAITRTRQLFGQALNYTVPTTLPVYSINRKIFLSQPITTPYVVFLHGTTWKTKHWPEAYWLELAKLVSQQGLVIKLPWGNKEEQERAHRIAALCPQAQVLPRLNLKDMASVLAGAKAIVAVDTGLGHLAAALDVPTVSLYGPTNPNLSGALGVSQRHIAAEFPCAPCLSKECTYQGSSSLGLAADFKLPADLKSSLLEGSVNEASSLYPPCFTSVTPALVWGRLADLL